MKTQESIVLKDTSSFSKDSFKLVGALVVAFILGLIPLFNGYVWISLVSAILIAVIMTRKEENEYPRLPF
jgi:hypothetical protein